MSVISLPRVGSKAAKRAEYEGSRSHLSIPSFGSNRDGCRGEQTERMGQRRGARLQSAQGKRELSISGSVPALNQLSRVRARRSCPPLPLSPVHRQPSQTVAFPPAASLARLPLFRGNVADERTRASSRAAGARTLSSLALSSRLGSEARALPPVDCQQVFSQGVPQVVSLADVPVFLVGRGLACSGV